MLRELATTLTRPLYYLANAANGRLRYSSLRQHYMAIARRTAVEDHVTLFDHAAVHDSQIGRHTYVGSHSVVAYARIGRFCCIGPGVRIGPGRHPTSGFVSSHPIFYSTERHTGLSFADRSYFDEHFETRLGNDVWIGANAVIFDGVSIGDGAIVGAGAIVTKDVAPYAIVGGVPAQSLRTRFSAEDIEFLLRFRWWDRSDAWLAVHFRALHEIGTLRRLSEQATQ